MTRTTRKRLFYALVLLFFVVSGAVIFYAEGWRLDLTNLQTQEVGAIFVRSFPQNASIFLNGKPMDNKSGFLSAGTLISNLSSGYYLLTLKDPGYLDWNENMSVSPALVTELKYAVLVPRNASSVASTTVVKNFFVAGGAAVTEGADGTVSWRGGTIGHGDIVAHSADLKNLVIKNPATGGYTVYDLTAQTSVNLGVIPNIMIDPYDPTAAIAANSQNIWAVALGTGNAARMASSPAGFAFGPSIAFSQSYLAWSRSQATATSSQVVIYDKFLKAIVSTSSIPGMVAELKWASNDQLGVVAGDGSLYLYNVNAQTFQKLADDVKDFYPTESGGTIAALEHKSIEILPVTAGEYYRFNVPDIGAVKNLTWYKDESHLFIEYPDHVSFLDFADAGLHNLLTVSNGTAPFYAIKTNSLYLIDQGQKLVRFDFPN